MAYGNYWMYLSVEFILKGNIHMLIAGKMFVSYHCCYTLYLLVRSFRYCSHILQFFLRAPAGEPTAAAGLPIATPWKPIIVTLPSHETTIGKFL